MFIRRWQHNWQKGTLWKRRRTSRHLLLLTRITGGKYETRPKKNLRSSEFPLSLALTIRHLKKGYTRWDWHVEEYCLKTLSAQGLQYWSTRETLTRLGHSAQLTSKWFRAISKISLPLLGDFFHNIFREISCRSWGHALSQTNRETQAWKTEDYFLALLDAKATEA